MFVISWSRLAGQGALLRQSAARLPNNNFAKRNGKVATSDDQISLFHFSDLVKWPICLTQYGLMVERHWR